jgi:hypothetical protein
VKGEDDWRSPSGREMPIGTYSEHHVSQQFGTSRLDCAVLESIGCRQCADLGPSLFAKEAWLLWHPSPFRSCHEVNIYFVSDGEDSDIEVITGVLLLKMKD